MHYTTKPISGLPGCYIGGGLSPFCNALGICIAILKKEGCCPDTIYLANEHLKTFAKIDDNGIGGYHIPYNLTVIFNGLILGLLQCASETLFSARGYCWPSLQA